MGDATDHVAAEECIDPAHNKRVGNDHSHVALHHAHHAVHSIRISHGVWRRLATVLGCFEVGSGLVSSRQSVSAHAKRTAGQDMMVRPDVDAVQERPLFANCLLLQFLWRRGHQDASIVSKDASQDHDHSDGEENPVSG